MSDDIYTTIESLIKDKELQEQYKKNWDKLDTTEQQALYDSINVQYKEMIKWYEKLGKWLDDKLSD
jgi:hypothetical protein